MYRNQFGVYKIELNNKIYIGSTVRPFKFRWQDHLNGLKGKNHCSTYLQNAYNKYGASTLKFSILEIVKKKEDCISREQYYIDILKPQYNTCKIAGSSLGLIRSEETRKRISESKKGIKHSEKHKENMRKAVSKALTGKKYSEEHKRNISKAKKGKKINISEERRKQLSEQMKGNTYGKGLRHTEEFKEALSKRMQGNTYARGCS